MTTDSTTDFRSETSDTSSGTSSVRVLDSPPPLTSAPRRRAAQRPSRPWLVLATILTCQLMVVLDATIVNIALPDIHRALNFSTASLSWVINAYTLVFGGLLLLGARAGDLLGRRLTFGLGIMIFTLASLVGGFATTSGWLLAARAVQGVGAALAAPSGLALLTTMFPGARERTRAIGWYTAVSIGGSAVGLILGGILTQVVSWRWVLFVNVPIGVAVLLAARASLPETTRRTGHIDVIGAITSTVAMTALVYGFVRAASDGWGDATTIAAFVVGVSLLVLFVLAETRAPVPITPLRLFADRTRSASYLARLLLVGGMFGMFFFLTQFLQDVLGYSPVRTGLAFLPLTVALFAASRLSASALVARMPARILMVGGLLLSTTGVLWLTQLSSTSQYVSVLGPLVLFGIGNGLAFVPLTSASLAGVEPGDAGAASGLVNVMQQVGGALGLSVLVSVFGAASRDAALHGAAGASVAARAQEAFIAGADRAFAIAAAFLFATAVVVAVAIREPSKVA